MTKKIHDPCYICVAEYECENCTNHDKFLYEYEQDEYEKRSDV